MWHNLMKPQKVMIIVDQVTCFCLSLCQNFSLLHSFKISFMLLVNFINRNVFQLCIVQYNNLHRPIANLSKFNKGAYISSIKVLNHLPQYIKALTNNHKYFKSTLKRFLYHHSFYSMNEYYKYKEDRRQAEACNTDTTPTQPHRNSNTHRTKNNTTNVVIQQNSRKLLMMDILMSETC